MFHIVPAPLITERLTIRKVESRDLADLLDVHRLDEVTRFLPYATWTSMADAQAWFGRTSARHDDGSAMQLVVAERASGRVIGSCLLFHFEPGSDRAEIGYVLGRDHWGRGVMQEALPAVIGHAFGPMGLRRLEAEVDPRNGASERVLLRLGFTREGLLRQRWAGKGEVKDALVFGLLRDEWQAAARRGRSARVKPPVQPMMILVAGPYRSGTNDDPARIAANVSAMTAAALQLSRAGHLPMLGEWVALPLIEEAGSTRIGDAAFDEIFHPISRRLVAKCDACLRIGGPSAGADEMVALARRHGKAVYFSLQEIPAAGT